MYKHIISIFLVVSFFKITSVCGQNTLPTDMESKISQAMIQSFSIQSETPLVKLDSQLMVSRELSPLMTSSYYYLKKENRDNAKAIYLEALSKFPNSYSLRQFSATLKD